MRAERARHLRQHTRTIVDPGLLLGYGAVSPEAAEEGVRLLADAVHAAPVERGTPPAGHSRARVHLVDGASACAGSVVPP